MREKLFVILTQWLRRLLTELALYVRLDTPATQLHSCHQLVMPSHEGCWEDERDGGTATALVIMQPLVWGALNDRFGLDPEVAKI